MRRSLLIPLLVLTLTGCTPPAEPAPTTGETPTRSATPTRTASATPTIAATTAPEAGIDTPISPDSPEYRVNGFSARAAWEACVAVGKEQYADLYVSNDEYLPESVQPYPYNDASPAVIVTVGWKEIFQGVVDDNTWYCYAFGDPDAPTVNGASVPDV